MHSLQIMFVEAKKKKGKRVPDIIVVEFCSHIFALFAPNVDLSIQKNCIFITYAVFRNCMLWISDLVFNAILKPVLQDFLLETRVHVCLCQKISA